MGNGDDAYPQISFRLSHETLQAIRSYAEAQDLNQSQAVKRLIEAGLKYIPLENISIGELAEVGSEIIRRGHVVLIRKA